MGRDSDSSRPRLGIFAKEPVPGTVKTRLCPPLTPEEAALLYEGAIRETVQAMSAPGLSFDVVICPAGDPAWFARNFPGTPLLPQGEGDLGYRMSRVLAHLLEGSARAALIGTDSPDLPATLVEKAFRSLSAAEAVLAPAADGGYVLVGERRHRSELFRDIPWSTSGVLRATRRRAAEAGIGLHEIGGWEDVDDLDALHRLIVRSPFSPTARLARRLLTSLAEDGVKSL